jgi:uncharacterized protein (DUF1015 family)
VSIIRPFRALRPAPENAKKVSSVPYDVIFEDEVRTFVKQNPYSFLRITRAEGECELGDVNFLERARENLRLFIEEGILIEDPEPAYYVYRLRAGLRSQTGIVGCCLLSEYENGKIKRHEKTRPDKVADRTDHMVALRAQTGLIFLAFRSTEQIDTIISTAVKQEPLYDFFCDNDIRQTVWKITDFEPVTEAFREVDSLYIADGHHRIESSLRTRDMLRGTTEGDEHEYVMAGMFPARDLQILAYNRIVRNMGEISDSEILSRVAENFTVTKTETCTPTTHGEICMYLSGSWYDLRLSVNFIREPDPIDRLDVSILERYVLEPVFGITDVRTDERIGFVGGIRGNGELKRMVDEGEARAAFSLFPTTIDDLMAVSDAGEIMPPKSTWFEPKLKDGLFVHLI